MMSASKKRMPTARPGGNVLGKGYDTWTNSSFGARVVACTHCTNISWLIVLLSQPKIINNECKKVTFFDEPT
jgi:hypothetical protein